MFAFHFVGEDTVAKVVEEDSLHASRHFFVVEEDVGFEVVLEAAEVDVRRTAGADGIVADEKLGVEESRLVEIDFYASFDDFRKERAACPFHNLGISVERQHESHIHT